MKVTRIALLMFAFALCNFRCSQPTKNQETDPQASITVNNQGEQERNDRIHRKAKEALTFCKKNGFNSDYCILIDMKIHSGKHRMFVYDLKNKKVERSAMCAHGCGKDNKKSTGSQPIFSNEDGSLLTSLGKYRIGIRSYSQWGINVHYKLHGLEESNNNAFKRIIVLHSHTPLSSTEIFPDHLPMGWSFGCPVTDDDTMTYLDNKLKHTKKSVLLWIYYK